MTSSTVPELRGPAPWWRAMWVKVVATLLFTLIAFYLASNWIGTASWRKVERKMAAAGETVDLRAFIPPALPDDQNFGALPLFKLDGLPPDLEPKALKQALMFMNIPYSKPYGSSNDSIPYLGPRDQRKTDDEVELLKQFRAYYHTATGKEAPVSAGPPELLAQLCPALANLRAAESTHLLCRFQEDFATAPAGLCSSEPNDELVHLARSLAYEETLALRHQRPDLALADLRVGMRLYTGLAQNSVERGGLHALTCLAVLLSPMTEGLSLHLWNDAQLEQLDLLLGQLDLLDDFQSSIRATTADFVAATDLYKTNRTAAVDSIFLVGRHLPGYPTPSPINTLPVTTLIFLLPGGWFDQCKAEVVDYHLFSLIPSIDPAHHRIYPDKDEAAFSALLNRPGTDIWHNTLSRSTNLTHGGVGLWSKRLVYIDMARIVCRLERYHLAHGTYPANLDALSLYGPLPVDPLNGQAYHYRLKPDGTFLLYSVGLNGKDDGGKGYGTVSTSPYDTPDWLWNDIPKPTP